MNRQAIMLACSTRYKMNKQTEEITSAIFATVSFLAIPAILSILCNVLGV